MFFNTAIYRIAGVDSVMQAHIWRKSFETRLIARGHTAHAMRIPSGYNDIFRIKEMNKISYYCKCFCICPFFFLGAALMGWLLLTLEQNLNNRSFLFFCIRRWTFRATRLGRQLTTILTTQLIDKSLHFCYKLPESWNLYISSTHLAMKKKTNKLSEKLPVLSIVFTMFLSCLITLRRRKKNSSSQCVFG